MNSIIKKSLPIKELPNGQTLELSYYEIHGEKQGPHVHIQSSVHGAEIQGNLVILNLLKFLAKNPLSGSITLIPQANPIAANQKSGTHTTGRFNPTTGDNWNRNYVDLLSLPEKISGFKLERFVDSHSDKNWDDIKDLFKIELEKICENYLDYQAQNHMHISDNKKLNICLQKLATTSDIMLDLHTGPVATKYLYSALYEKDDAVKVNFPHILYFEDAFAGAMDEASFISWVKLWRELEKRNIKFQKDFYSYTLELGSEEVINSKNAQEDTERILSYLNDKNIVNFDKSHSHPLFSCSLSDFKTYFSHCGGLCEYIKTPGDEYKKGDLLAKIYQFKNVDSFDTLSKAEVEIIAPEDGIIINRFPSSNVSEGVELFQVMTNYTKIR